MNWGNAITGFLNSSLVVAVIAYFLTQRSSLKQRARDEFRTRYIKNGLDEPLDQLEKHFQIAKTNKNVALEMLQNLEDYILDDEREIAKTIITDLKAEIDYSSLSINKRVLRDIFSMQKDNAPFGWINEAESSFNRFNARFLRRALGHHIDEWLRRQSLSKAPSAKYKKDVKKYIEFQKSEIKKNFAKDVQRHYRLLKCLQKVIMFMDNKDIDSMKKYNNAKENKEFLSIVDEITKKHNEPFMSKYI